MGLFDAFKKKDCEICGKEVGMFGYKKLEDGEICKDCVKLLSPWFDDRRHSTVEQIKQQLVYREQNKVALETFYPSVAYDGRYTLRAEVVNGIPTRFVVERANNYKEENADIVNFKDVTSFNIDVQEFHRELKQRNPNGEDVSFDPPRYEYSYDFFAEIYVNHPYFDKISFPVNRNTLHLETASRHMGFGGNLFHSAFDPSLYPEYRQYRSLCDEMEAMFRAGMQGMAMNGQSVPMYTNTPGYGAPAATPVVTPAAAPGFTPSAAPAAEPQMSEVPKFCPNCGSPSNGSKFCQNCGSKLG